MTIYDRVFEALTNYPQLRSSDKKLIWHLCSKGECLDYGDFMKAPSFESITRARRKAQALHPELRANTIVTRARKEKETKKGYFVFHEETLFK